MIHTISFKHAWEGIRYVFKSQPNMRFHSWFALLVIIAGYYFQISSLEWFVVIFTILLMFTAEMLNTAVESMIDLITVEYRNQAKIAKDTAAGMVLINAIGSVVVGLIIFLPHVMTLIWPNL